MDVRLCILCIPLLQNVLYISYSYNFELNEQMNPVTKGPADDASTSSSTATVELLFAHYSPESLHIL